MSEKKAKPERKPEEAKEPKKAAKPEEPAKPEKPAKAGLFLKEIAEARKGSRQRKFSQSWDLSVSLRGMDLKKPESRLNLELALPEGRGKDSKVAVFADTLAAEAEGSADTVVKKAELESLAKDKKKLKKLAREHEWFFGEVTLMAAIGKSLGGVLGPRGKMPKPIPPKARIEDFVKRARETVRVRIKDNPVIHVPVGTESMPDEKVARNAEAAFSFIRDNLPKGRTNIKAVHIKLSMGPAVKVKV